MNEVQIKAVELIKNDLRFLYTIFENDHIIPNTYYFAFMPYMGVIIDGVEDWIKAYNNSSKIKLPISLFNLEEQEYYEAMRSSIKMFESGVENVYKSLEEKYLQSKEYFSSICKPIAKKLHLYDIFSTFEMDGVYYDNTILDSYYIPFYNYGGDNGEFYKRMAIIGGKYINQFDGCKSYTINKNSIFSDHDYGGFVKFPLGYNFNYKFLLFSIYCQINFIIKCVDELIQEETTSKLRFSYILYYYLLKILPDINAKYNCNFKMNDSYNSEVLGMQWYIINWELF